MRRRFFVDRFAGQTACLEGEAAHHLGRVLHAEPGQLYELSDGNSVSLARIERVSVSRIDFSLLEKIPAASNAPEIQLLVAIVKFDRFEWALEKATELGVRTIIPLSAERTDKKLLLAAAKRAERWRKILRESAQQARCLRPPLLENTMRPAAAFSRADTGFKILFSERPSAPPVRTVFAEFASQMKHEKPQPIALAVGPEGGWTDQEFQAAALAGFRETSLGGNILRAETALIAGLAAVHLYFDPQTDPAGQSPEIPGAADLGRVEQIKSAGLRTRSNTE
jgi:16S rRNA (uracil1498-N3)-methyltransferase